MNSCNSTPYEIEEVDEYSDTSVTTSQNEIKQEVEQPKVEIKTETGPVEKTDTKISDNSTEPQSFIIQLGAFDKERNARELTKKVKEMFNFDISYSFINGLYKVRTGVFSSKDEAVLTLSKVKVIVHDAFITVSR
jgi:cell division septation protein DedD